LVASLNTDQAAEIVGSLRSMMQVAHVSLDERPYFVLGKDYQRSARDETSRLIVDDLGDKLMDIAEADSELEQSVAALLFDSFVLVANNSMSSRMQHFLGVRLLPTVQLLGAEMETANIDTGIPKDFVDLSNAETQAMYRYGDTLLTTLSSATRADSQIRQGLVDVAALFDHDQFAAHLITQTADRSSLLAYTANLLGINGYDLNRAVNRGFGYSTKTRMTPLDYSRQTFLRMMALERQRPGICRTLYKENRFRNFGRHSEEMFVDIYDRRGEINDYEHQVYMLFASDDNNGSALRNSAPKLEILRKKLLAQKIGVTVAEFMDERDLKILLRNAKLAKLGRACIVISDSHGAWDSIGDEITIDTVKDWLGEAAGQVTTDDAEFLICACSTADYSDGFAATLHAASGGRTVHGSRGGSWLRKIDAIVDETRKPHLQVDIGRKGGTKGRSPLRTFKRSIVPTRQIRRLASPAKRGLDELIAAWRES
jgi:hypothetical protein